MNKPLISGDGAPLSLAGKFSDTLLDGQGAHSGGHVHVDSVSTHAPPGAIIVPDAHLLFTGDFKRSGVDLVLSGDDRELVLHDYFKGEKRAALASPDGAHLTGDIVNALTGHTQLAQADGSPSTAQVIGHVTKLAGTATAIRNGVSIILNQGDNVNKGDVVQSGSDSTLGITFIDGSVFGLGSNAKMVLNEMVYDPNGSSNSSLLSLVQGTISFVAGATAKKGDMKVDTPVATMGIRGTAVLVEIDFVVPGQGGAPPAKFQVLVEPDGTTGSYILFDKTTLTPIATVNQAGTQTIVNGQGTVNFLSSVQLSPDAQKIITDVFALKFSDLNNPQSKTHFTDIGVPEIINIKLASGETVAVEVKTVQVADNSGPSAGGPTGKSGDHIPGPPGVVVGSAAFTEHVGTTGSSAPDTVTGKIEYTDVNAGDRPTAKAIFASFAYQNAQHTDVTSSLTAKQIAAIHAVEVPIVVVQDPTLINNGTATWTYSVADGAFDFLAAGETLTLTYIAQVDNNFALNNETTVKSFTVTITGTNDKPVITTGPQHIAFVGGKTTPGGPLTSSDATSGTLSFNDVDLTDTHTVSTKLTSALLKGAGISQVAPAPLKIFETALTASIVAGNDSTDKNTGTINWQLADLAAYLADFIPAGQTLSLVYTVTVTDSQGATSSQNIVVDITGNNTPAVVWIATTNSGSPTGGLWSDTANWETGTVPTVNDDAIIITDQLRGLTPSYPVTIASAATAKSLTMDDFGTLFTNSPTLINNSTLMVGAGGISLGADSVFKNTGTVQTAGLMEVLNQSSLQNSGTIFLDQGGDFKDQSVITNSGTIGVWGGPLNIEVDVANTGGDINVNADGLVTLAGAAIAGGTITGMSSVEIVDDSSLYSVAVSNGWLTVDTTKTLTLSGTTITATIVDNHGTIHVTGDSAINGTSLLNTQSTIDSGKTLTLDDTIVANGTVSNDGAVKVDASKTLFLQNTTLSGGTISNVGTVAIAVSSSIENATFNNTQLRVTGYETLTLSGTTVTGGNIDNFSGVVGGTIDITGDSAINGAGLNKGQLTVEATKTLTLDDTTVTGTTITDNGTIKVDATKTLKLNGVALDGGAIGNSGTIEITGSGSITNDALTNNQLTVDSGQTLTLDGTTVTGGSITDAGTVNVASGTTLKLNGVALDGGIITNAGTIEITGTGRITNDALANNQLTVDGDQTLTLNGTTVTGGAITNTGATLAVDLNETVTLNDVTVTGGSITDTGTVNVAFGKTLTLNGVALDGGIVTNAGTIEITGLGSITNDALANNQLTVDSGQTLTLDGTTVTGGIITNTDAILAVSATTTTVTLDDVIVNGGSITDNGTVHVDTGSTLTLNGVAVNGGNLTNDGTIDTTATTIMNGVGVANAGTIEATSGVLKITGSVVGNGSIQVDAGAFLELNATVATTQKIVFDGAGSSEVQLDASTFGGQILGMAATDQLDLRTIGYGLNTTGTYVGDASGGVLTITDGLHSISMTLVGDYLHAHFAGASDGNGGTLVTLNADDDKPTFTVAETSQTGSLTEFSDTTGSSALNTALAVTGSVHFTDIDLVDRPTATITLQSVTWVDGVTDLTESLWQPEIDALEQALLLQQAGNTNNGAIGWTYAIADDALDFLGDGQTATVTSTLTLDDHEGKTDDTATVTITITGANDAPDAVLDTDVGHIIEAGNDINDNVVPGVATTFGDVLANDTDVDRTDTHNVIGVAAGTASGELTTGVGTEIIGTYGKLVLEDNGTWTYTLDNDNPLTDALAQGAYASDIFSYTETDHHGGTSTTTLTIDITGTNDAPVISTDQLVATNGNGTTTLSGLAVTDVDATSTESFTMSATTAGAGSGSTVTPAAGSDTLANVNTTLNSGIIYHQGSAPTDMVTLTVADGAGATDTVNLIFNATQTAGPVTLTGTTAKDVFFGTGYQDQFVFAANSNHDTIMSFKTGQDHIDLSAVASTSDPGWFSQHVTAGTNPADTLVTIDAADTIVVRNVHLTATDFILHAP